MGYLLKAIARFIDLLSHGGHLLSHSGVIYYPTVPIYYPTVPPMKYSIDLSKLGPMMRELARSQIPFAMSKASNIALTMTRKNMQAYMAGGAIKGGVTPFTKSRLLVEYTTKRNIQGGLFFSGEASYMKELIFGGNKKGRNNRVIPEPDVRNPPKGAKILTSKGNFRRNWLQNAMRLAGTPADAQWSNLRTKKPMVGAQGYQIGASKKGVYGLWQWIGKGKTRKPELLVYLSRKNRDQRPTFAQAPEVAARRFERNFRTKFPSVFNDAIRDSI